MRTPTFYGFVKKQKPRKVPAKVRSVNRYRKENDVEGRRVSFGGVSSIKRGRKNTLWEDLSVHGVWQSAFTSL